MTDILEIKFKMSSMLTKVIELQDGGVNIDKIQLEIPYNSYGDIIYELQYMDNIQLNQIYEALLRDCKILNDELEMMTL